MSGFFKRAEPTGTVFCRDGRFFILLRDALFELADVAVIPKLFEFEFMFEFEFEFIFEFEFEFMFEFEFEFMFEFKLIVEFFEFEVSVEFFEFEVSVEEFTPSPLRIEFNNPSILVNVTTLF